MRELAAERGLTLVFVRTQRGADRLAKNLLARGFRADRLHGGMSQPQRERALDRFATGRNDVLVATDVAARGLDLDGITHVINFDAPADEKAYVHRVGPHGPGRTRRGRHHVRDERAARGDRPDGRQARAPRGVRGGGDDGVEVVRSASGPAGSGTAAPAPAPAAPLTHVAAGLRGSVSIAVRAGSPGSFATIV